MWQYAIILFWPFDMSSIFIQKITIRTKLTRYWKVRDQIDTIQRLRTKLKYALKNRDQICSLSFFEIKIKIVYPYYYYYFYLFIYFFFRIGDNYCSRTNDIRIECVEAKRFLTFWLNTLDAIRLGYRTKGKAYKNDGNISYRWTDRHLKYFKTAR